MYVLPCLLFREYSNYIVNLLLRKKLNAGSGNFMLISECYVSVPLDLKRIGKPPQNFKKTFKILERKL